MSNNEDQQHIPTNKKEDEQEEDKGSGGLLAPIGDPVGKRSIVFVMSRCLSMLALRSFLPNPSFTSF